MATAHAKHHDYHLVDPSPWPVVGSISAFIMAVGAIAWMHHMFAAAPIIFGVGTIGVLYTMASWWGDVIREAQYTDEEYPKKKGWGHSTVEDVLCSAAEAQAKQLALFHHDPMHDDAFMDRIVEGCRRLIAERGYALTCFAAAEGQLVEV